MAAGKSTRMKSAVPKAAHPMCGKPVARHIVDACIDAGIERIIVVVGYEAEVVKSAAGDCAVYVTQDEQLGTGHAVKIAREAIGDADYLAVFPADTPLIRPDTIRKMLDSCIQEKTAATLLSALIDDPAMYGRIVRDKTGKRVLGIVEAKDALPDVLAINEICTSIYAFDTAALLPALEELRSENRQKEYYLTDVIGIFVKQGLVVEAHIADDSSEALGINNRVELASATSEMRKRIAENHMLNGVTIVDPATTYIDVGVEIGADTTLYPNTILERRTRIGPGCVIGPNSHIISSVIQDGAIVNSSVVEDSEIGQGARVGPFSRIRPQSNIGQSAKIGNFVEIKKSIIGEKVSLGHLTYVGDSEIGARTNIGAGTITCNYDGKNKHRTKIGSDAFIGSNTVLNAPVEVGDGAFTGSGSVITKDIPADALGLSRSELVIKEGWAKRRRERQSEAG